MKKLLWFEFDQNNSGGHFDVDEKVCHRVFIQEKSREAAIDKAMELGIYFDGCSTGRDCSCCGDRWHQPWNDDGIKFPLNWGKEFTFKNIVSYAQFLADKYGWTTPDTRIYFKNGKVKEIFSKKE